MNLYLPWYSETSPPSKEVGACSPPAIVKNQMGAIVAMCPDPQIADHIINSFELIHTLESVNDALNDKLEQAIEIIETIKRQSKEAHDKKSQGSSVKKEKA